MSDKKNHNTDTTQEKLTPPAEKSAKKTLNLFTVVILLLIAFGIYLYQKGYIKKDTLVSETKVTLERLEVADHENRIDALHNQVNDLRTTVETLTKTVAQQQESLNQLAHSPKHSDRGTMLLSQEVTKLTSLLLLRQKIHQGLPYQAELKAFLTTYDNENAKVISPDNLQVLKDFAPFGAPSLLYLIETYQTLERDQTTPLSYDKAETIGERIRLFFKHLISIKRSDHTAQRKPSPSQPVTDEHKAFANLKRGDVKPLIDLLSLSPTLTQQEQLWITHAKAYEAISKVLETVNTSERGI